MALLNHNFFSYLTGKLAPTKGTAKAFAAGEAVLKSRGVNDALKDAVRQSLRNDQRRAKKP